MATHNLFFLLYPFFVILFKYSGLSTWRPSFSKICKSIFERNVNENLPKPKSCRVSRATLNFSKFNVALKPSGRIFLTLHKVVS